MRRFIQIVLVGFALLMVGFALTRAPDANASVAYVSPYTFEQTYGGGLRLLRVDLGYKILEKDKDTGYILFEYSSPESGNKVYPGSMELVETKEGVHVAVQIPAMPQYHERMIVDALAKKLSTEYGEPPKRDKDKGDKDKDDDKDKPKDGDKDKPKDGDKDKPKDGEKDQPKDG
jgi:hypothetical protein